MHNVTISQKVKVNFFKSLSFISSFYSAAFSCYYTTTILCYWSYWIVPVLHYLPFYRSRLRRWRRSSWSGRWRQRPKGEFPDCLMIRKLGEWPNYWVRFPAQEKLLLFLKQRPIISLWTKRKPCSPEQESGSNLPNRTACGLSGSLCSSRRTLRSRLTTERLWFLQSAIRGRFWRRDNLWESRWRRWRRCWGRRRWYRVVEIVSRRCRGLPPCAPTTLAGCWMRTGCRRPP